MSRTLTKEEIGELSAAQRLELIDVLWDSLAPGDVPVPEWHKRLLDEALDEYERDPDEGRSWEDVRDEIFLKQ
ncbi:MAG TPA: addiction module protein [Thermoanaerobaculia bacterium]|nr:addiction module protein [Thermoanaerobaculia bacterium]